MIKATCKFVGNFVDRPSTRFFIIENEDEIAIRRKNPETNKIEQFTIRELFDYFKNNSSYLKNQGEREFSLTEDLFPTWFHNKYLNGTALSSRIISISYERIE